MKHNPAIHIHYIARKQLEALWQQLDELRPIKHIATFYWVWNKLKVVDTFDSIEFTVVQNMKSTERSDLEEQEDIAEPPAEESLNLSIEQWVVLS